MQICGFLVHEGVFDGAGLAFSQKLELLQFLGQVNFERQSMVGLVVALFFADDTNDPIPFTAGMQTDNVERFFVQRAL